MRKWPAENMEMHFDEVFDACLEQGPQLVTVQDEAKVVLISYAEWEYWQNRQVADPEPKPDVGFE